MLSDITKMLVTLSNAETYNKQPPAGPPDMYPKLTNYELEDLQKTAYGQVLGRDYAYTSLKLIGDPCPIEIETPKPDSLDGKFVWSIDGSNNTLDYSAFHLLLSRAAIVEYSYSFKPKNSHHEVRTMDCGGVCMVDGNIFGDGVHLFGNSTANVQNNPDVSWIDVISNSDEPLIVSFDPDTIDKKPSSHASGWSIKFMQTLELMSLGEIPSNKSGVVIRDGALFPICATNVDTVKSLSKALKWDNKFMICSSKRISESTLFVELLMNPQNEDLLQYYFPEQNISTTILKKLPADYLLLPKILSPGQRTPFIEAIPRSRSNIPRECPELTPICCYYMRKRAPHTIIRLEFPRKYLGNDLGQLEWALQCVAWQHELGTKVPHVQEFADRQCQLKSEVQILKNITANTLLERGLETLEVYE